jgi:hypothetical protein
VSGHPDRAPQSQAHLYYFLARTKRAYGDATNIRMSYCRFLTVSLVLLLAHRALESDVVVTLREQKARSLIAPPIVGRAICRCSQHATRMVTAERDSGFTGQLLTRSGYVRDSRQAQTRDSSGRERAKRRPRVIASRSAYASRGSVGL